MGNTWQKLENVRSFTTGTMERIKLGSDDVYKVTDEHVRIDRLMFIGLAVHTYSYDDEIKNQCIEILNNIATIGNKESCTIHVHNNKIMAIDEKYVSHMGSNVRSSNFGYTYIQ
uniref:Uncharacterized protein n=1 Tax=Pithovirus LCPAC101 TaxID=2506586 RepID=A0A481Z207_9VIRU|nr:MAG: hypothetical protein LCPAC101_00500 [Pithovirus LCPAC101]